jgi:hypothetical protein
MANNPRFEPDHCLLNIYGPAWKRKDGGRIPTMDEQEGDTYQRNDSDAYLDGEEQ